ncbi:hypothetical protein IZY60_15000, partial [Lutibacter sp. B2]|nr:hypothetical protein [Lutibacter sp. B2]
EYVNGKLTRKFVYTDENTQDNKNTDSDETTSPKDTNTIKNPINTQNDSQLTTSEKQLYTLINQEREKAGLSPVSIDMDVVRAARLKSEDMAKNHYFAHTSPTYGNSREMLKDMNINFSGAAENIAINGSVSRVHSSFMTSSTHKANILSNGWTHVGIGIAKRTNGTGIIVTEIFLKK